MIPVNICLPIVFVPNNKLIYLHIKLTKGHV